MANKPQEQSGGNLIIVMLLVTLLVIGVSALVTKSLISAIILDGHVYKAKSLADKNVKQDVDAAPKLVAAYQALGPQQMVLTDALPTKVDFPSLLVEIENMANTAGVTLKGIAPNSSVSSGGSGSGSGSGSETTRSSSGGGSSQTPAPQQYPFTISYTGTYQSTLQLLTFLESSARPMIVNGISLTGSGQLLTGGINVTTYYQDKASLPFGEEDIK